MQIDLKKLREIMKESNIAYYRDNAPTTAKYPYIVYEFVNETHKKASNRVFKSMPMYQIALITDGTEGDYEPLKRVFDLNRVPYASFFGMRYDENDSKVMQYITYVRCVNGE